MIVMTFLEIVTALLITASCALLWVVFQSASTENFTPITGISLAAGISCIALALDAGSAVITLKVQEANDAKR